MEKEEKKLKVSFKMALIVAVEMIALASVLVYAFVRIIT